LCRNRAAGGGAALCAALALACRSEPGALYRCECTFVTDFDDDVKREVEVCAPSDVRAEAVGRGCAQSDAPGPVQRCACARAPGREACATGACRAVAGAP
jgi:hypothetical protein